jgi:neutral ceramidase
MTPHTLHAGAAQRVITPPVGLPMAGWRFRAAGDNIARYVHDDLHAKALVLRRGDEAWAMLATDLVGVDALATGRIRQGAAQRTGLRPESILVSATHCHSGPAVCPVASAQSPDEQASATTQADGSVPTSYGKKSVVTPTAYYAGETSEEWRDWFIDQAIEAVVQAWQSAQPAEVAFGEVQVEGLASSRRVLLADGSWADPRQKPSVSPVVSRTEVDPLVRVLLLRELDTGAPLAGVINYGSHPWVFSIAGYSAELAGATAKAVAAAWCTAGGEPPIILYTSGPQGDVTLIWNIDIEKVWFTKPGEVPGQSLARRERAFDDELARLGGRLATGVLQAIASAGRWESTPELLSQRLMVAVPLKQGYSRPPQVAVAGWQEAAPEGYHLTEVQALRVGRTAILGLPGEPFASLGTAIRARSSFDSLLITALTNDFGAFGYVADRDAYALGGYELTHSPTAAGAGEALIEGAVQILHALGARKETLS